MKPLALLLFGSISAMAYVHFFSGNTFVSRADNANIQFYLTSNAAAGLTNVSGKTWIASGSDIPGAAAAALNTWNQVTTANIHFAPLQTTTTAAGGSGQNTIVFDDTVETRLMLGSALAVTIRYGSDTLDQTNVFFSPTQLFSTTLAAGSYDFQSVLTHELGHCLGADHTGVLSATMFQASLPQNADERVLSQDDLAFVTETYPSKSSFGPLGYGTITGNTHDAAGNVLGGALITAQDPVTGIVVGSLSNFDDGSFSFIVPAGNYQLWAEPLSGIVLSTNLYLPPSQVVATNFQIGAPSAAIAVPAGSVTTANIVTGTGISPIAVKYAGVVPAGQTSVELYEGPSPIPSWQQSVFLFNASGLGADLADSNISFVGPMTLVPGSVFSLGTSHYQVTINIPVNSTVTGGSMILNYNGATAAYSGGFVVQPVAPHVTAAGVGNGFNYASGAVAPGEIVAIFGSNVGPVTPVSGALNGGGTLATILASMQVTFDGISAPIFFASNGQINVEVPYEVAGKSSTTMIVSSGNSASAPLTIPVQAGLPGLFGSALNPDGSLNSAANPASAAQYVSLFATGLGTLTESGQAVGTGQLVSGAAPAAGTVMVSIDGGVPTIPYYAGAAPGFTGLDQVNLVGLTPGQHSVAIVGGQTNQSIPVWVH